MIVYFSAVLFIVPYKVFLTFDSLDEILKRNLVPRVFLEFKMAVWRRPWQTAGHVPLNILEIWAAGFVIG